MKGCCFWCMGEGTETRWRCDANYTVKVEWRQAALTFSLYTMFRHTVKTAQYNNPSSSEWENRPWSVNVNKAFWVKQFFGFWLFVFSWEWHGCRKILLKIRMENVLKRFDFSLELEPAQTDSRGILINSAAFIFPENSRNRGTAIKRKY